MGAQRPTPPAEHRCTSLRTVVLLRQRRHGVRRFGFWALGGLGFRVWGLVRAIACVHPYLQIVAYIHTCMHVVTCLCRCVACIHISYVCHEGQKQHNVLAVCPHQVGSKRLVLAAGFGLHPHPVSGSLRRIFRILQSLSDEHSTFVITSANKGPNLREVEPGQYEAFEIHRS